MISQLKVMVTLTIRDAARHVNSSLRDATRHVNSPVRNVTNHSDGPVGYTYIYRVEIPYLTAEDSPINKTISSPGDIANEITCVSPVHGVSQRQHGAEPRGFEVTYAAAAACGIGAAKLKATSAEETKKVRHCILTGNTEL
ncbi:hypothetical protein PG993_004982 [Apiospora rasikravindrae]|uniref:Uncharacterized protein n=1 Tax=Apiospora rasikravindrae TaxID=990691 RepID=A0ABR1TH16_9PEZI